MARADERDTPADLPYGGQIAVEHFKAATTPPPPQPAGGRPAASSGQGRGQGAVLPEQVPAGAPLAPELEQQLFMPTGRPQEPVTFGLAGAAPRTLGALADELVRSNPPSPDLLALQADINLLGL